MWGMQPGAEATEGTREERHAGLEGSWDVDPMDYCTEHCTEHIFGTN